MPSPAGVVVRPAVDAAAAEAWARERGHARMRVRSNVVRERAHRFYERLGYTITKRQAVFDKRL